MKSFPKEFPSNIPHILAGFIALNYGTFLMTALFAEILIDLGKYDYISRVFAIPVMITGADNHALGVVARFRPTSKRTMFLVYDQGGKLVYQELFECHGLKGFLFLSLDREDVRKEYLYLDIETPKAYRVEWG